MKKLILIILFIITTSLYFNSTKQNVRFTSYHPYDLTGSGECTASTLCIDDFKLNEDNIYTYNDKIVLATANKACTKSSYGVCSNFNSLPEGYREYDLYDEIEISYNNKKQDAIILDICGACYLKENYQRYDIFVKDKEAIVDTIGYITIDNKYKNIYLTISIILFLLILIPKRKKYKKRRIRTTRLKH